jgi:hypothetical protein
VLNRARDYGYELKEGLAYEMDNGHFVVEFMDEFGFIHSFSIVEVEG